MIDSLEMLSAGLMDTGLAGWQLLICCITESYIPYSSESHFDSLVQNKSAFP